MIAGSETWTIVFWIFLVIFVIGAVAAIYILNLKRIHDNKLLTADKVLKLQSENKEYLDECDNLYQYEDASERQGYQAQKLENQQTALNSCIGFANVLAASKR